MDNKFWNFRPGFQHVSEPVSPTLWTLEELGRRFPRGPSRVDHKA